MQKQELTRPIVTAQFYVDKTSFIKIPCCSCGAFAQASMNVCPVDQNQLNQNLPHFDNNSMLFPLVTVLGEGGMGTVYKAIHPGLGKHVAIKIIHQTDELSVKRFQLEAKALSRLNHKSLISVFDFGVANANSPYMIMEFVDGQTLHYHNQTQPSLSLNQIVRIFREMASALDQVHSLGIIHRDLKPENVILAIDAKGNLCPKLIDFGIAKSTSEKAEANQLTMAGTIVGSPIYMSPEQCYGEALTHLTDIYSFGCMLFESITGQPPFKGKHFIETVTLHATAKTPTVVPKIGFKVCDELIDLVYSCLEKNPKDRPQSMEAIAVTLAHIDSITQPTHSQVTSYDLKAIPRAERTKGLKERLVADNSYDKVAEEIEGTDELDEISEPARRLFKPLLLASAATAITLGIGISLIIMSANLASQLPANAISFLGVVQPKNSQTRTKFDTNNVLDEEAVQGVSQKWLLDKISQKQLDISGRYSVDDDVMKALTKVKDIEMLNLGDDAVTDQSTKYYSHLPLKALCLRSTAISDISLKEISKIKTLNALDITSTAITDKGLAYLRDLPNLKELHLHKCVLLTDQAVKPLMQIKSLELLDVSKTKLSDNFLESLTPSSNLAALDISDTAVTDNGLSYLEKTQIRDLDASNLQLTKASISSLKHIKQLRKLKLTGCYQISSKDIGELESANPKCRIILHAQ